MVDIYKLVRALLALIGLGTLLAGCGGGGINSGPGGGGGGTLDASYTGPANTEYGCYYGQDSRLELGQGFRAGSNRYITKASFNVYRTGAGTGAYVVDVQSDSAGLPSGVALGTSNPVLTASLSSTAAWQDFTFAIPAVCDYGRTYWLVLRKNGGVNNVGEGLIAKANTNPDSYTGGRLVSRASNGTWQELGNDALFRTYSRTAP